MNLQFKKRTNIAFAVCASSTLLAGLCTTSQAHPAFVLAAAPAASGGGAKPTSAPKQSAFQTGVSFYNARRYREAAQYFTQVIKQEPSNSDAYYYLGTCQHLLGDKAGCIKLYEYIVKYFPGSPASVSAGQYLAKNSLTSTAGGTEEDGEKLKDTVESLQKAIKKAATAPASIASLVQVVRARADRPNVSGECVVAIKQALDKMPPTVKDVLWASGVRIFVTPTVEDYEPGVKYQEARGYEGGTYKSCPAFYQNRKIVIAERTMHDDETVKEAFPASDMINSLYHETGHALDFCMDGISHTEGFRHAYRLDAAHVEPGAAHTLRYYLQKSEDGQEECCAELIGNLLGQTERHTAEMRANFPLTLKFLRGKLGI